MFEILLTAQKKKVSGFGLFATRTIVGAVNKYLFSTNAVVQATQLSAGGSNTGLDRIDYCVAVGNYAFGIYAALSGTVATTKKYTYAQDIVANGSNLLHKKTWSTGVGNNDIGMVVGATPGVMDKYVSVYTYSTGVVTSAANLADSRIAGCGIGNSTTGVVAGSMIYSSSQISTTKKCSFGTNLFLNSTSLSRATEATATVSTPERGYICGLTIQGGHTGVINRYSFASEVINSGLSLLQPRGSCAGAGDSTTGIIAGGAQIVSGQSTAVRSSEKMNYASEVISVGTNLTTYALTVPGLSSTPGSF